MFLTFNVKIGIFFARKKESTKEKENTFLPYFIINYLENGLF